MSAFDPSRPTRRERLTSNLRSFAFWIARGLTALVVGTFAGMLLLACYWAMDPTTRGGGFGVLVFFPAAALGALPLIAAIGFIPLFILGGVLDWVFSFPRKRHEHLRTAVAALLGVASGYLLLRSNLSFWGDAVPGALFGGAVMVAWCLVEQPMRRFLLTAPIAK